MVKIYCDKCGKESTDRIIVDLPCEKHQTTPQVMGAWIENYYLCIDSKLKKENYYLCRDCFNKLKKWINEE